MPTGRIAVVTGAAGTLGLAAARVLLEDNVHVALVDVDAIRLDSLIRFLRGPTAAFPCDVSDPLAVRDIHRRVEKELGAVDILVNAASLDSDEKVEGTADLEWRRVLSINLDGAFHWSRAVIPGMKQRRWGRIVNVTALSGKAGGPEAGTAYGASKGGLTGLTLTLARELATHGVTVNAVAPAFVKTPTITDGMNEAQRRQLLARIPVGRFAEPEEFGHAVRYLVSPLAGFVTGQVLHVDGGLHLD